MIREANVSDISAIAQLKLKMFQEAGTKHIFRKDFIQEVESVYRTLYEEGKAQHFVIDQEDKIITCAGAL